MAKLEGRVAIITGAASGMGRATARLFAKEGALLSISDVNMERLERVDVELREGGTKVLATRVDISKREEVDEMVAKTVAEFGRIDILVNNAAYVYYDAKYFYDMEVSEWDPHINITLRGTLYVTRAVVPHMIEQKSGRIISITSNAGKLPIPSLSLYSAAKAAIAGFSRCLAIELAPYNILVNCIAPGGILTAIQRHMTMPPGEGEKIPERIPLGVRGKPEDIAGMVLYLASDDAEYVTGQQFSIDGGMTMT